MRGNICVNFESVLGNKSTCRLTGTDIAVALASIFNAAMTQKSPNETINLGLTEH